VLIDGHNPADYAAIMTALLHDRRQLEILQVGSRRHAENFGWQATTHGLLNSYSLAIADYAMHTTSLAL